MTSRKQRGVRHRPSGDAAVVTAYLDPELALALKRYALDMGVPVTAVVADAVRRELARGHTEEMDQ